MKDELTVSSKMLPPRDDIRVEFTGRNLTKFGGIQLVRKFLIWFGVKEELESAVPIEKRNSRFSVGGMLVCLLYAVILDMKRQSNTLHRKYGGSIMGELKFAPAILILEFKG